VRSCYYLRASTNVVARNSSNQHSKARLVVQIFRDRFNNLLMGPFSPIGISIPGAKLLPTIHTKIELLVKQALWDKNLGRYGTKAWDAVQPALQIEASRTPAQANGQPKEDVHYKMIQKYALTVAQLVVLPLQSRAIVNHGSAHSICL